MTSLGPSHAIQYTGIIAMVVESELLYTAFLILYIVPFSINSPLVNAFIQAPALVQVCLRTVIPLDSILTAVCQAVSALMIVYRVADGKGWTKDTCAMVNTSMRFGTMTDSSIPHRMSTFGGVRGAESTTLEFAEHKETGSEGIFELERKGSASASAQSGSLGRA